MTLGEPSAVGQRIGETATALFEQIERRDPVRLVGVRADHLRPTGQAAIALWDDDAEQRKLEGALDHARERFGLGTITRARHIGRGQGRGAPPRPGAPQE